MVDERPIKGPFVPSEAYAAFLRGAIAEASGDLAGAVEGYAIAVTLGPRDAEPWVRLGDARCARDPRDAKADDAFGRALAIDEAYAPVWEARARCAARRGDPRLELESAKRAVRMDPSSVSSLEILADADGGASPEVRAALVAMTLDAGADAAAFRALAGWARGAGDSPLEARALSHVTALEPGRAAEIDAAVVRFAGDGAITEARALARARLSAAQHGSIDPAVARFAIDDALFAGDMAQARRFATKADLPLVVVAARALLLGKANGARVLAEEIVAADPRAEGARFVLAAAADALGESHLVTRALDGSARGEGVPVPAEVWLAYARVVAREGSVEAARAMLRALPREAMVHGDAVTTPVAVALAERGALEPSDLDANARIELAERHAQPAPDDTLAGADARHRLLALARRAPLDPGTLALAQRLAPRRAHDSIIAVAFARLSLAGAPGAPVMGPVLARLDPADPLVAAATRECTARRN